MSEKETKFTYRRSTPQELLCRMTDGAGLMVMYEDGSVGFHIPEPKDGGFSEQSPATVILSILKYMFLNGDEDLTNLLEFKAQEILHLPLNQSEQKKGNC